MGNSVRACIRTAPSKSWGQLSVSKSEAFGESLVGKVKSVYITRVARESQLD